MLTSIALILLGVYVAMPQAVAITLIVFGAVGCFSSLCNYLLSVGKKMK